MGAQSSSVMVWLVAAVAVICNAGAQVLMKHSSTASRTSRTMNYFGFDVFELMAAMGLYGLSFFITAWVYARMPLSVASPVMAGAIFLLIAILSVFLFSEAVTILRLGGMMLIVMGVLLLVRNA